MTKTYSITEVGERANRNANAFDFDRWLERTIIYIQKKIDPDFDRKKFLEWLDGDAETAFISGKNRYFW